MKVLQLISSFPPAYSYGGAPAVTHRISKELVRRGHDVTVFTTDVYSAEARLAFQRSPQLMDGIKVYHFRNLSNWLAHKNLTIAPTMAFALRKYIERFDVIHLSEYRSFQAALVHHYAAQKHIPYVLQAHGSLPRDYNRLVAKQNLKKIFDWVCGFKMLKDAKMVIASTETEANQCERMGVDKRNIRVIPNALDPADYANPPEQGAFRRKYGLKNEDQIVLYLGRIHKVKGVDLLLEAFSTISQELMNAKLVIVGPDEGLMSDLKSTAHDLQIDDRVIFTGPIYGRAKFDAFNDADVYVLPSQYESFSITVLEASACGTPVIVTDRCAIAGAVKKCGLVVEYDVNQLCDALREVLSDDVKRCELGEKGRDLVQKEFRWDKVVDLVEKTYQEASSN